MSLSVVLTRIAPPLRRHAHQERTFLMGHWIYWNMHSLGPDPIPLSPWHNGRAREGHQTSPDNVRATKPALEREPGTNPDLSKEGPTDWTKVPTWRSVGCLLLPKNSTTHRDLLEDPHKWVGWCQQLRQAESPRLSEMTPDCGVWC